MTVKGDTVMVIADNGAGMTSQTVVHNYANENTFTGIIRTNYITAQNDEGMLNLEGHVSLENANITGYLDGLSYNGSGKVITVEQYGSIYFVPQMDTVGNGTTITHSGIECNVTGLPTAMWTYLDNSVTCVIQGHPPPDS